MITWTMESLAQLGPVFLRNVHAHMRGDHGAEVRFGVTGEGQYPNYQITHPQYPDRKRIYLGRNHERFNKGDTTEFNDEALSRPFSYDQIGSLLS